jgi:hypothetical protein
MHPSQPIFLSLPGKALQIQTLEHMTICKFQLKRHHTLSTFQQMLLMDLPFYGQQIRDLSPCNARKLAPQKKKVKSLHMGIQIFGGKYD